MFSDFMRGLVEKELRRLVDDDIEESREKIMMIALALSDLAAAVEHLTEVTKKHQDALLDHQQGIVSNALTMSLIMKRLSESANTDLPDISFDDGQNGPN